MFLEDILETVLDRLDRGWILRLLSHYITV